MSQVKVALIMGAGDATGRAVAKRFAAQGYVCCLARRDESKLADVLAELHAQGHQAYGFGVDASDEVQVVQLIEHIEAKIGELAVLIFNVGVHVSGSILQESAERYMQTWKSSCFSGFLSGREAAKRMVVRQQGTIIFTGATASTRGSANFSAFAGAKHGLKALAQSMARELGPQGIHVVHAIIDGLIDSSSSEEKFGDYFANKKEQGGIINPEDVADAYWYLHSQPKTAWTHELDLRPSIESW